MVHDTNQSRPPASTPYRTTQLVHDLKNALAGLKLDASLLADDISANDRDRARILAYTEDLQRAIGIMNRLASELGPGAATPETVDSNEVLEGIVEMVDRTLPFSCAVELDLEPVIWPVKVDPRLLHQALVNLVTRAQDAMPGGGMLHLASKNRSIGRAAAGEITPDMAPGRYVRLSVGTLCGTTFDGESLGGATLEDSGFAHPSTSSSSLDGALEAMRGFSRIHHGPMMTTFELYLPARRGAVADLRCLEATESARGPRKV